MSLSVCCLTNGPAGRLRELLSLFRPVADELVVAVDCRSEGDVLRACSGLADVLVRVPYRTPPERQFPWLHAQCSSSWIFRVDSDEVPSRALLAALPDLARERKLTHCWVERRWLYPTETHFLAAPPWTPDYQLRLVRNDPALVRFPGEMHTSAEATGPGRFLELPLYHLDCIVNTLEDRRRKVRLYERVRPGVRVAGSPLNQVYLPEHADSARTRAVPAEDRQLVATVLNPPQPPPDVEEPAAPLVASADIERFLSGRPLRLTAYHGRLDIVSMEAVVKADARHSLGVRVHNLGDEVWPWGVHSYPEIRLAYRWREQPGGALVGEGRMALPEDLAPGGTCIVHAWVTAPERAGAYVLELDLVHEHVRWFGCEARTPVDVRAPRRVLIVGGYSPVRHVGDDAIVAATLAQLASFAPEVEPVVLGEDPAALEARFGHRSRPSAQHYLLPGLPPDVSRPRALYRMLKRTSALVRAARRMRRGLPPGELPANGRELLDELAKADVLLATSAGSLTSAFSIGYLWPQLATILAADELGLPIVVSGVTVGPFRGIADRAIASIALRRAALVTVRDRDRSRRVLRRLGVSVERVVERVDDAMALEPAPAVDVDAALRATGFGPDDAFAAISLHRWRGLSPATTTLARVVDALNGRGLPALFVPMFLEGDDDDRLMADGLRRLCPNADLRVLDPLPRDDVILGIVGRARVAVGTRFHLAVFAAAQGVPALGIVGDTYTRAKLGGLADLVGEAVRVVPAAAPPREVVEAAERQLSLGRVAPVSAGHLPIITFLWSRGVAAQVTGEPVASMAAS